MVKLNLEVTKEDLVKGLIIQHHRELKKELNQLESLLEASHRILCAEALRLKNILLPQIKQQHSKLLKAICSHNELDYQLGNLFKATDAKTHWAQTRLRLNDKDIIGTLYSLEKYKDFQWFADYGFNQHYPGLFLKFTYDLDFQELNKASAEHQALREKHRRKMELLGDKVYAYQAYQSGDKKWCHYWVEYEEKMYEKVMKSLIKQVGSELPALEAIE